MPVKVIDKKDEAPDGADVHELKNGKFLYDEPDEGAKETLNKLRGELKDEKKARKAIEDKYTETLRELEVEKTKGGEVDKRITELSTKFKKELDDKVAEKEKEHEATKAQLRKVTLTDKAREAFLKAGGRPEKADAAMKLNADRLDLLDGKVVVLDGDGEVTTTSLEDHFGKAFKKETPEFFTGTKANGGGAGGDGGDPPRGSGKVTNEDVIKNPSLGFASSK